MFQYKFIVAGDQGTEIRQKKKMVITEEHFQRVTQALIMRLRQHEETVMQDGTKHILCQTFSYF